jgi:hypothetical protein
MSSTMLCAATTTTKINKPKTIPVIINFSPKQLTQPKSTPLAHLGQTLQQNTSVVVSAMELQQFKYLLICMN